MKTAAVRYYTKTGNTEKLANAIAATAGVTAAKLDTPVSDYVDVLFLGASIYAANIDKEVKDYIAALDPSKVGCVAVFSTSALIERSFPQIKAELEKKGIKVCADDFYCRGQFLKLYKGRPDASDLAEAEKFTKKVLG